MSYQLFELVSRGPHELGVFSLIFLVQGHCRELDVGMGIVMSALRLTFHLIFEECENATRLIGARCEKNSSDALLSIHR
jgi:hypothetical protein